MKKILIIVILITLLLGCQKPQKSVNHSSIVVTSPELAEIICALGEEDRISGITKECDYPASLQTKKIVGTFGKVDIEKIVALQPSIVFTAGMEQEYITNELNKLDLRVVKIFPASLEDLMNSVTEISAILGIEDKGQILKTELELKIQSLRNSIPENKQSVFVEICGEPLMSVSDESYVGELIELAGFNNIFSTLPRPYSRISSEELIIRNPDHILVTYPGVSSQQVQERKGWDKINAVVDDRIYTSEDIDINRIVRATPRSILYAETLRGILNGK